MPHNKSESKSHQTFLRVVPECLSSLKKKNYLCIYLKGRKKQEHSHLLIQSPNACNNPVTKASKQEVNPDFPHGVAGTQLPEPSKLPSRAYLYRKLESGTRAGRQTQALHYEIAASNATGPHQVLFSCLQATNNLLGDIKYPDSPTLFHLQS